jgi:branched-subunit amino acid transport protein
MPEKKSKYDTDPLDPDFVRRTEELMGRTQEAAPSEETAPFRRDPAAEEPTRRFDEQMTDSYPSVFVPPTYQPPARQPFTSYGQGQTPPPGAPPPPGPSTPYQPFAPPSSRTVTRLGISEKWANMLAYVPYIGLAASLVELLVVPRGETRTRFHAAQGLALHLAIIAGTILFQIVGAITGSGFGGSLFRLAGFVFLVISAIRVWQGKPHHVAPLDDARRWLDEHVSPMK